MEFNYDFDSNTENDVHENLIKSKPFSMGPDDKDNRWQRH